MSLDLNRYNERVKDWMRDALQDMRSTGAEWVLSTAATHQAKATPLQSLKPKNITIVGLLTALVLK
jgi:hypothetical protein